MDRVDRDDSRAEPGHPIDKGRFCCPLLNLVAAKNIISTVIEICSYLTPLVRIKDFLICLENPCEDKGHNYYILNNQNILANRAF